MKHPSPHPYRADVDGLRAIAVMAVILFHANSDLMPGGFVGVDIFFVISGFLITGLIAKGIESGSFSFADFYTRRIKRILPPYILVALVTLFVSTWLLIPNDYIFYTTSLAASWGFASNVFFSMLSWGYFGARTEEFPLLHTWSLSVEEQFYFIFPVILIFLYRYLRKWLMPVLTLLALVLLAYSEAKTGELRSYFLLHTRAHEMLIGALTFYLTQRTAAPGRAAASLMSLAGVVLMFGSLFLIVKDTPFPGLNSLYPCLGAALVIYAGRSDNLVSPLLKSRPMVAVGLISYSLYLWHWPIFSFLRYRRIALSLEVAAAAILLAFVLAYLTWKFVERPVRESKGLGFKDAAIRYYALPAAAFMSIGLYSYMSEGAPNRFSGEMRELISSYSFERDLGRTCSIRAEDYRRIDVSYLEQHCAFGEPSQPRAEIMLMGDSHGNHFKPFVEQLALHAHRKAVFHVQGGCWPTSLPKGKHAQASTCEKRNADLLELAGNYKYVVLGGFWSDHPSLAQLEQEMGTVVEKILAAGATPVIFKDNAYYEPDLSQCILHRRRGWLPADTNCNIPIEFAQKTQGPVDAMIDRIASRYPGVKTVDPKVVMCKGEECMTYIGNTALYKDANHINKKAAELLANMYIANVGNPFPDAFMKTGPVAAAGLRQ